MSQTAKSAAGVVPWRASGLRVVVAALALGAVAPAASGQVSTLDDRAFMEALQRRGMIDVMNRFMATTKTDDPLLSLQFKIAAAKAKATQQINRRNKKAVEARKAAALEVMALYEELFEKAPTDHWEQPIWKTDYCDWVLGTVLPDRYVYAHLFVQYGRPISKEPESGTDLDNQRAAYDRLVAKTIKVMDEAADQWRELEVTAPRQPGFTRNFVNTGRWRKLKGLYGDILLPFHHSWAIYHGHFMTKPDGDLKEAAGLIKTVSKLPFMKGKAPNKAVADFRQQIYSREGRIYTAQKNYREALSHLNAAINNRPPAAVTLPAAIARPGGGGGAAAGIWDVPVPQGAMTNDRKFTPKVAKNRRSVLVAKSKAKPSQQPGPTFKVELTTPLEKIVALRLDLIPHNKLGGGSGTGRNGNFMLSEIKVTAEPLKGAGKKVDVKFTKAHATFSQARPRSQSVDQAIDGKEGKENGWAVSPNAKKFNAALFVADKPFGFKGGTKLTVQLVSVNKYGAVGHFRFALTGSSKAKSGGEDFLGPINISKLPTPEERAEAQKKAEAARKKAEAARKKAEAARKKAEADANKSSGEPDSMIVFETKLAKAYALAGAGRVGNGLELLERMSHQKPANASPLLLVLIADAKYLIDGKNEKHYKTLLDSPEASGWKTYIEEFLVKRDGAETPDINDENIDRFFASVKLILNKGNGARDKAKEKNDPEAKKEAKRHYTDADGYLKRFLQSRGDDLTPDQVGRAYQMRAKAQYNLGLYDATHMGEAALFFIASAKAYKGQKDGEDSCKYGLVLSQKIYDLLRSQGRPVANAADRLAKAYEVLFDLYSNSGLAKTEWYEDQKFFYGEFLTLQKQWKKAFDALDQVKPASQYHVRALYLRSRCAHALWIEAPEKKKEEWARTVREVGTNALRVLPLAIRKASGDPKKKKSLRKAAAITKLNLAEIKYEALNDPQGASIYLENFDQLYNDFPELLVDKQRINIGITIQTGKMDTALADINKFVKADPQQARLLLRNLLPALNRRIKSLRATDKGDEAQKVADFALMLAKEIMFPLAKQSKDDTLILNYSLIVANQEMVAGKTEQALASYKKILDENPNNLNANKGLFDALIAVGKETEARALGREMDFKLEKQAREGELGDEEMEAYWEVVRDLALLWDREYVRRHEAARTDVEKRKADEYGAKIWKYLLHKRQLHRGLGPLAIQGELVRLINRHDPE